MAEQKSKGVRTQHPSYAAMSPLWKRCQDAAKGEHAIHAAGETYLPKLAEEEDRDYTSRKGRTPFFNASWRTISGLKGMLFRKDPIVKVAKAIEPYLNDIDMAGTPLSIFAQEVSEENLTVGRLGLLVDRPPMPQREDGQALTVAQTELLGLRPTIQKYSADSIINWKVARVGNAVKLVMVVLAESADVEDDDEFGHKSEDQYRVLDLIDGHYRQRVYRVKDQKDEQVGGDLYPTMNNKPMTDIPFFFAGVNDISPSIDVPPLLDLIDMNLHHYQVSADFEHGCHWSGLPTLFLFGTAPDKDNPIYIGGSSANCVSDPTGHVDYAQVEGGFEALQKNLESKKSEMAVLGARMLENSKSAVESAETIQQRTHGEQSQLSAMSNVTSMAIQAALQIFSEWAGSTETVEYQINTDFIPASMSPQELTALTAAWQAGLPGTSDQNVYALMQQKEMADPLITFEEEQERISTRTPQLMV